jgi:hypothetical protein
VLSDFHEKAIGVEGENKVETQRERKFDAKNYMTPEQCAELIVHAEQDGTRELVRLKNICFNVLYSIVIVVIEIELVFLFVRYFLLIFIITECERKELGHLKQYCM